MISFKEYSNQLNEKTFELAGIVDFIFDKYYKNWFVKLKNLTSDKVLSYPRKTEFESSDLNKFDIIAKANEINPVTFRLNNRSGNSYSPHGQVISINVSSALINFIKNNSNAIDDNITNLLFLLPKEQFKSFTGDIEGKKLKSSIAHEVAHWLDDTFHDRFLFKTLSKAQRANKHDDAQYIVNQGFANVALTNFEVQSQIHQIEELKRNTEPDVWNSISFAEMLSMDGSLFGIDRSLDFKERKLWHKILLRRMSREKLLGKKMR